MKKNLSKWIIIGILIAMVVLVIVLKNKTKVSSQIEMVISNEISEIDSIDTSLQKPDETLEKEIIEVQETEIITPEQVEKIQEKQEITEIKKQKKAEKDILALVNDSQITESYFNEKFDNLQQKHKDMFKHNKEGFLDQMIIKELLFLKAKEKGYDADITVSDKEILKDIVIQKLIKNISSEIEITDKEMKTFYNEHESEMKGASFEQVKSDIRNYLVQQKQSGIMDQYIEELKSEAAIFLNEEWIKIQQESKPKNPLTEALKNSKPTVLDIGAGTCIPCKMMKPIFEQLEIEYKDKANILLLEISDHRDIANEYKVRIIPTQIFFDKSGNQYWRHEGFLSKDEIIEKLNELEA